MSTFNEILSLIEESGGKPKITISNKKDRNAVNEIYNSMSREEKYYLDGEIGNDKVPKEYATHRRYETNNAGLLMHATIFADKIPVSFVDVYDHDKSNGYIGEICVGTRGGDEYRNKGYASMAIQKAIEWFNDDDNKMIDLRYYVHSKNKPSIKFAIKNKFKLINDNGDYATLIIRKKNERT